MNCKPGDLAYVHGCRVQTELNGRIVTVIRRAAPGEVLELPGAPRPVKLRDDRADSWIVESKTPMPYIIGTPKGSLTLMTTLRPLGDRFLRPIRDNDGEDETLTWAGKPQQLETTQ